MAKYSAPFTKKCIVTTPFKKKGNWQAGYHTGVDVVAADGDTAPSLYSPAKGTVQSVNACGSSYGNHIVILTSFSQVILMAHMKATPLVKEGQSVRAGTKLGVMGSTGNSSGPHLHIEVQNHSRWAYNSALLNPSKYIDFKDFAEPSKTLFLKVSTKSKPLNIRKKPSPVSGVATSAPKGAKLIYLGKSGNYYKVQYKSIVGYAVKKYLEIIK